MRHVLRGERADAQRPSPWRLAVAAVVMVVTMTTSACGSDDDSSEGPGMGQVWGQVAHYQEAAQSGHGSHGPSVLRGVEKAPAAARAGGHLGPPDVSTAHQRLADAAEDIVAGLRSRAPQT